MNKNKLNEQVQAVVNANLNEQVSGAFKARLEELERIESQIPELNEIIHTFEVKIAELAAFRDTGNELEQREIDVSRREKEATNIERDLVTRNKILEIQEKLANVRVQDHKDMFGLVFRNRTISQNVLGDADNGQPISRTTTTKTE